MLAFASSALATRPALTIVTPRGVQRGTEATITFSGARLADIQEILYYQPGITTVKVEPIKGNANAAKATIKIAPDCELGEKIIRVRTAGGVTDARTFYVGPYPAVAEKEPNSEFTAPQKISNNSTVHGVVQNEDVDYYVIEAKAGERISAEVEGIRLGTYMFDPYVAIMNAKRFELSASDDTPLLLQDAFASTVIPEDGTYIIQVRESSYGGNGNCRYRLHVGNFPRPLAVYPAGGKLGEQVKVKYIGDVKGDYDELLKLPGDKNFRFAVFSKRDNQIATSPNKFRVSEFPNVMEKEPNNSTKEATATELTVPLAFNGIIEKDDPYDWFKFKAKKGQQFDVRCYAQRIGSPLDPVLYIYNAKGSRIASNDDSGGQDSYLRFNVPADGEYIVGVRDHLRNGGPTYVYRIEFQPRKAGLTLNIPEFVRYRQDRNRVVVHRGNRFAQIIRVGRNNFGGDVKLSAGSQGLPQGVTMHTDVIPSNTDQACVVFEAAADAPVAGRLIDFHGEHATNKDINGKFVQNLNLVFGSPNNTVYYRSRVDKMAVAVAEEVPFKVTVVQPKVPIVRNGTMSIKVVAEKKDGWDGAINLYWMFRPPGIGAIGRVTIAKGKNEAYYPINANGGAAIRTWKLAILASASVPKGPVWTSTQLFDVTVAEPYISVAIDRAAGEQGQKVELVAKLNQLRPYDSKAKIVLHGIPAKVTTDKREQEITKDTKEVIFPLTIDKAARPSQYKSLFCQVIIPQNGENIYHNTGGGTILRVDPPPPPKKDPPKPKPQVAKKPTPKPKVAPKPAPKKRLSRLEMLRLKAKERAEGKD